MPSQTDLTRRDSQSTDQAFFMDNVQRFAPHGRPNLRSRLHLRHSQEGGPRKFIRTCGGIGKSTYIKF